MKKANLLASLAASTLLLAACGNGGEEDANQEAENEEVTNQEENDNGEEAAEQEAADSGEDDDEEGEPVTLTVGASNTPHGEILEFVQPQLEEEGIELEIVTYDDYVLPNEALDGGDLDANYYQHIPFLENSIEENGYDLVSAGGVHVEPIGAYSHDYDSLADLPDGADILVSNNLADYGRILKMFEDQGLIEVDDNVDITEATFDDIVDNPHDFNFDYEYDPGLMPTLYENNEGDVVFINANFAVDSGIDILEEVIELESTDSPYVNVIAIRAEDEGDENIEKLLDALHSQETKDFINDTWEGAVIPADE